MDNMKWLMGLDGIVMIAFGFYIFGIGLWGLTKKRPLVFAARQLMWFLIAVYIPITIQSFLPLFSDPWGRSDPLFIILPFFQVGIFVLLVYIFWQQMTGYLIFGISDETFRDALISALI